MRIAADVMSSIRALLVVPVLLLAYQGNWQWAMVIWAIAWATDLADGHFARQFGSVRNRHPNLDMDGVADSVLAFGGALIPVAYAWRHYGDGVAILFTLLYAATVVSAMIMVSAMNQPGSSGKVRLNMVVFHGLVQIVGVSAWLAYMAFNTAGIVITLIILIIVTTRPEMRSKIKLWWIGRLA